MYKKIIKPTLVNLYLIFFYTRKNVKRFIKKSQNILHNIINQKITLYIILSILISLIVTNSIQAKELPPEELGKDSIIFNLVSQQEGIMIIEDTLLPTNTQSESTTPNEIAVVSNEENTSPTTEIPEIEYNENTTTLTMGGLALTTTEDQLTPHTRTTIEEYVIQPGDTVTSIAKQFGISINSILWSNNLSSYSILKPGKTLKILPFSGTIHTITSGDTLESIAKKYQANAQEIAKTNQLNAEEKLTVGDELLIPGGIKPRPKPKPKPKPRPTPHTPPANTPTQTVNNFEPAQDSGTKLLWPAKSHRINQYYSWRHNGLDINGRMGDPVYASEDGVVEVSRWNTRGYGYYIIVNHGNGIKTLYAHNSKLLVKVGQKVSRGDVIALIGSTGNSTGPHVHYEVRVNGRNANPLLYTK